MSVKVDLDQLAGALGEFTIAYLITVGDDFHAHTVAVDPVFTDGVLDVGPVGKSTRRNLAQHGDVTLLWPPPERGGYTLIVDGVGTPPDDGAPLLVVPRHAVLHRRAASPPSAADSGGCLQDCAPLEDG